MVLIVPPLPKGTLLSQNSEDAESRSTIRQRVIKAYNIQLARQGKSNDKLTPDEVEKLVLCSGKPVLQCSDIWRCHRHNIHKGMVIETLTTVSY
jgi:predicted ATPase with chaperone activity